MNSFGLGIVLDFVDNASSGMRGATEVFNSMSAAASMLESNSTSSFLAVQQLSAGLSQIGGGMESAGKSILSIFTRLAEGITNTGSDFESFRITLRALYSDTENPAAMAEQQLKKLVDFAATSPFEIADSKDFLITLKSQGIDAFGAIKSSIDGAERSAMQWIGDLRAFKPDEPLSRWRRALQNYIGSGEDRMLRNILDMGKITDIIGRKEGATPAERMQDIADIVAIKGLSGLMDDMLGTWEQTISNFEDNITKFLLAISDAGAYERLKGILTTLTGIIANLEDSDLESFASVVADAFNSILAPVEALAKGFATLSSYFIQFAIANPEMAKFVVQLTAIAGAGLLVTGIILKLSAGLMSLAAAIHYVGGLRSGITLLGMSFGSIFLTITALTVAGYALYRLFNDDLGGAITTVQNKVTALGIILEALFLGKIRNEHWDLAQSMGIVSAITWAARLHFAVVNLFNFFASKLDAFTSTVSPKLETVHNQFVQFMGRIKELLGARRGDSFVGIFVTWVERLPEQLENMDWSRVGLIVVGGIGAAILARSGLIGTAIRSLFLGGGIGKIDFGTVFNGLFNFATLPFTIGARLVSAIFGGIGKLPIPPGLNSSITALFMTLFSGIPTLLPRLFALMFSATKLGPLASGIVELLATVFRPGLNRVGALFTPILDMFNKGFGFIIGPVLGFLKNNFLTKIIMGILSTVGGWPLLIGALIVAGLGLIASMFFRDSDNPIIQKFVEIGDSIKGIIDSLISWAITAWNDWGRDLVLNLLEFGGKLVTGFVTVAGVIFSVLDRILPSVLGFVSAIGSAINHAMEIFNGLIDFLVGVFTGNWDKAWGGIKRIFSGYMGLIGDAFDGVRSIIEGIVSLLGGFGEAIDKLLSKSIFNVDSGVKSSTGLSAYGPNAESANANKIMPASQMQTNTFFDFFKSNRFATGGEIGNTQGMAYLDPNEVVINGPLTRRLNSFLTDYSEGGFASKVVNPIDEPAAYEETIIDIPEGDSFTPVPLAQNPQSNNSDTSYDYHVEFTAGSIVLQTQNLSDAELEKAATKLMKLIERKQQLRAMAIRK